MPPLPPCDPLFVSLALGPVSLRRLCRVYPYSMATIAFEREIIVWHAFKREWRIYSLRPERSSCAFMTKFGISDICFVSRQQMGMAPVFI
jgi:hypothetical protein